jgi:predicted nucleotidyltransferase
MSNLIQSVLALIQDWRSKLPSACNAERVCTFGSLVYRDGVQFVPALSDVDLLISFSKCPLPPWERVISQQRLVTELRRLECSLRNLIPGEDSKPLASVSLLTEMELRNNIHKDDKPSFWRSRFVEHVVTGMSDVRLEQYHAETFKVRFPHAVQTLRDVQRYRNQYLRVSCDGTRIDADGEPDPLPKKLCRSAAGLRYFIEREEEDAVADVNRGATFFLSALVDASRAFPVLGELTDRVLARVNRGNMHALSSTDQLLLWEILAEKAIAALGSAQAANRPSPLWRPPLDHVGQDAGTGNNSEGDFLTAASRPSLRLGSLDIACKIFPEAQWQSDGLVHVYEDDPEAERQVQVDMLGRRLPDALLDELVTEIENEIKRIDRVGEEFVGERDGYQDALGRLTKEGSNAYPRLASLPLIEAKLDGDRQLHILRLALAPSRYGIALVEERRLQLPTARELRGQFILNSLAVRIAYLAKVDDEWWVEFHQRHPERNSTYRGAWDIGAAGYLDEQSHRDPADTARVSPWQAARHELAEELAIPIHRLPHRDKFRFFGVGRNDPTGQVDLLGYCEGLYMPSMGRPPAARVLEYGRCRLTPRDVAKFVLDKVHWVPTALLTAALILRHFRYPKNEIEDAFGAMHGRLSLFP